MAHEVVVDAPLKMRAIDAAGMDSGPQPTTLEGYGLPWSYGRDRITLIVRDPDWAYAYWEITDEGLADARRRLGSEGSSAFCNLRIYDTTGRFFDGANANDFFDVRVERTDRESFLAVRWPARTVQAEIGLKSHEGHFQPIARSGAGEFPRKEPSSNMAVEWTTVVTDHSHPSTRPYLSRYRGAIPEPIDAWQASAPEPEGQGRIVSERSELIRTFPEAARLHRSDPAAFARWAGLLFEGAAELLEGLEWHAGPFPLELRGAGSVEIHFAGSGPPAIVERQGVRFLTQGPWNVIIRGSGVSGRRVLGTWSIRWSIASGPLIERWGRFLERQRRGVFARKTIGAGGSERLALLEHGASERWRLGASERLLIGASERLLLGSSQLVFAGATELALGGEQRLLGASERWLGASERWLAGASEQQPGGASEASESGGRHPWRTGT